MLCQYEFLWLRFEKFLGPIFHTMLGPPVVTILCVVQRILLIHECALHKKNYPNVQCTEIWYEKKHFKFKECCSNRLWLSDWCFLSTQTQYGDCPRKKGCPIVGKSPSPSSTSVVQFFLGHMTLMERNSSKMLVLPYNICILKQG